MIDRVLRRPGASVAGLALALGLLLLLMAAQPARAATLTVTTAADSGPGSLRQAILDANALPGHDIIAFDIISATTTISLTTALPVITDSLILDGTTQPGYAGTPLVELRGGAGPAFDGLVIMAGNSTVRGLILNHFDDAILLQDGDANTIQGNILGTDAAGTTPGLQNVYGVRVVKSSGNMIGGTTAGTSNTIFFNECCTSMNELQSVTGVQVQSGSSNGILGNRIYTEDTSGFGLRFGSPDQPPTSYDFLGGIPDLYDPDTGPNQRQNFPVLFAAVEQTGVLSVTGYLSSRPKETYRVELFSNPGAYIWAGETFLGAVSVTTDADGVGQIKYSGAALPVGTGIVATATDSSNNTSNYSYPIVVGSTYVVTTTADSGAGSLRRAILDANQDVGSALIRFNIGGGGRQTIAPLSPLPGLGESTILDATTQPGYAGVPLIELNGSNPGTGSGLSASSSFVIIKGFVINHFPGAGIIASYNRTGLVVQGNYIGTDASGMHDAGNGGPGVQVDDPTYDWGYYAGAIIGGTSKAQRNVIAANDWFGITTYFCCDQNMRGIYIRGNYVGVNVAGTAALGNYGIGIEIGQGRDVLIGGKAPGAGNVVAASRLSSEGAGEIVVNATHYVVQGNRVGTTADGSRALGGDGWDIVAAGSDGQIGGASPVAANTIAYTRLDGIQLWQTNPATEIAIQGNAIYANGGLGINLGEDGVTPNDVGDGDSGPNGLQNYPVLTQAVREGTQLRMRGTLNSKPGKPYEVDLYASAALDPTGYGEGQLYLGRLTVTTDASGNASFSTLVTLPPGSMPFITATATHPRLGTSEFSRGLRATL